MARLRRLVKYLVACLLLISCCCALLLFWESSRKSSVLPGSRATSSRTSRAQNAEIRPQTTHRAVGAGTERHEAVVGGVRVRGKGVAEEERATGGERRGKGAGHRLAVVIPFRDREAHLKEFVKHMVPFLTNQSLSFQILVVEQSPIGFFNRAKLSNIGFKLAKERGFDYICLHDVDMLPLNNQNPYGYPERNPTHLATCVQQFGYKLPFSWYCGGVILFTIEQYEKMNGMANVYFGWGKEDDDLYRRILNSGFQLHRPEPSFGDKCLGRYRSLEHGERDYSSSFRNNQLLTQSRNRQTADGLTNLQFAVKSEVTSELLTRVVVDVCRGVSFVSPEVVQCITPRRNSSR